MKVGLKKSRRRESQRRGCLHSAGDAEQSTTVRSLELHGVIASAEEAGALGIGSAQRICVSLDVST